MGFFERKPSVMPQPSPAESTPEPEVRGAQVIAFANQKGGVAKTTTTLNLAAAFGEKGHRVLCVDMDPQGNLTMIRENLNPNVQIEGILPTLVDTRTVHAKEAIELLEENFGDRVFASRITKTVRFAEAPVKGMSVLKYDPDGKAAYAYRELAREVLENGQR